MSESANSEGGLSAQAAPSDAAPAAEPRRRLLALPDGSIGLFLLVVFAALFGGLVASYWPAVLGSDSQISEERIAALETRVGQLATGRAGAAATGVFDELRRNLAALSQRLDANEARLTALEKGQPLAAPGAPGEAPAPTAALRASLDTVTAQVAQLSTRLAQFERTSATAEQIANFSEAAAKLQARVAALDADIARTGATQKGAMDAVSLRIARVEAAVPANLAQRLNELTPKADFAAAEARVARLEDRNAGDTLHRAAAILALANLAGAAADGRPFTVELAAFEAAQPGDPAAVALRPWAATGVPTLNMLRVRFPSASRAALDVSRNAMANGFFDRLWSNIESLVSVRRVGEVTGTDTEARLARAQVRVTFGDLPAAVAEVSAVGQPAADPLATWLRDARSRVTLDRALAQLNARVVRSISAQAPATTPPAPGGAAPVPAPKPSPAP